ncbi:hypothetical protein BDZ91DRAFT_44481 [Kalaharituber pfeilii]|nr:hypothetical protein BDZ91DRAFT_44481 [Kalaharituber pfeilii]
MRPHGRSDMDQYDAGGQQARPRRQEGSRRKGHPNAGRAVDGTKHHGDTQGREPRRKRWHRRNTPGPRTGESTSREPITTRKGRAPATSEKPKLSDKGERRGEEKEQGTRVRGGRTTRGRGEGQTKTFAQVAAEAKPSTTGSPGTNPAKSGPQNEKPETKGIQ